MKAVEVNGKRIALCNVDGAFYAVADECPHAGGSLSEGDLFGKEIVCPEHGGSFDVTTGAVLVPLADKGVACLSGAGIGQRHRGGSIGVDFGFLLKGGHHRHFDRGAGGSHRRAVHPPHPG